MQKVTAATDSKSETQHNSAEESLFPAGRLSSEQIIAPQLDTAEPQS